MTIPRQQLVRMLEKGEACSGCHREFKTVRKGYGGSVVISGHGNIVWPIRKGLQFCHSCAEPHLRRGLLPCSFDVKPLPKD